MTRMQEPACWMSALSTCAGSIFTAEAHVEIEMQLEQNVRSGTSVTVRRPDSAMLTFGGCRASILTISR
jgi:hypothetical protein